MDYKALLEHSFAMECVEAEVPPTSRLEYLSRYIFNFTTYDAAMDVLFAAKAVEVCRAISTREAFEHIKEDQSYMWYLIMCNMPFFSERIDWGTSIRRAWWSSSKQFELGSFGLWDGHAQRTGALWFSDDEWSKFIQAVVDFGAPEMAATQ